MYIYVYIRIIGLLMEKPGDERQFFRKTKRVYLEKQVNQPVPIFMVPSTRVVVASLPYLFYLIFY